MATRSLWFYHLVLTALVLGVACSVAVVADGLELVVNGGFESGPDIGDADMRLDPGSQEIPGWRVVGGSTDYAGPGWSSPEGVRSLDLEGETAFGGVQQTIPTEPGQVYTVTFDLAGNPDGEPRVKRMQVRAAGQSTERWFDSFGRTREDLGWQTHTWQFTATEEKATLEFRSIEDGPGHCGAMLDNVRVTQSGQPLGVRRRVVRSNVPEPSSTAAFSSAALRLDIPIPVTLSGGAEDRPDVVQLESVTFALDEGWLQARVSTQITSWPKGKWRLVVELLDSAKRVLRRGDVAFENLGIVIGDAVTEQRTLHVELGPWEEGLTGAQFRLALESTPCGPRRTYR